MAKILGGGGGTAPTCRLEKIWMAGSGAWLRERAGRKIRSALGFAIRPSDESDWRRGAVFPLRTACDRWLGGPPG